MNKNNNYIQKVALYGGSFDPIHLGHINLALEVLEKKSLDKVLFCPASINPHKLASIPAPPHHRLEMLKLAIADVPQFSIWEGELHRSPPSYTIDTIKELIAHTANNTPPVHYSLLLGEDTTAGFPLWHSVEEIISLLPLLVGMRSGSLLRSCHVPAIEKALEKGRIDTRIFDISSSEIRERISQEKYCGHLLPGKVLDYIYAYRLYSSIH